MGFDGNGEMAIVQGKKYNNADVGEGVIWDILYFHRINRQID